VRRALAALAATGVAAAATAAPPRFERKVEHVSPGRVAVRLDREVYENARGDLGDLRVLDEAGRLVPFLLDRGEPGSRAQESRPTLRNRGFTQNGATTVDLDFGAAERPPSRLRLRLSGDNFRRAVSVAGTTEGREWTTLVEEAWVFAVPGGDGGRYETIELPAHDYPVLRVRVRPGPDERDRVSIEDAWEPWEKPGPRREETLEPRVTRVADAQRGDGRQDRESWLTLDLGAAHQPFHAIELDVRDARFFREAIVEARRDTPASGGRPAAVSWAEIGRGALYRLGRSAPSPARDTRAASECLRLRVSGRERFLRVRLRNRDDRPLDVTGVRVRTPVERVVFEASSGHDYRLAYGSAEPAPVFDLPRTVGDAAAWAESAAPAGLAPPKRLEASPARVPWSERHPALLWTGLLAVVAALGLLTWRALAGAAR
jgi:hypothetical protein